MRETALPSRRVMLSMLAMAAAPWRATTAELASDASAASRETRRAVGARSEEVLRPTGGVPAHIAGQFRDPYAFQQAPGGDYFVFDRPAHAVWRIDPKFEGAHLVVSIGQEPGSLYAPSAFALSANGFVVADAPDHRERIQFFDEHGIRLSAFSLPGRAAARVTIGTAVINGVSSLDYTGSSVLINRPEDGALASEYSPTGRPLRSFGTLRRTGHEEDRDLHLALNVGLPLGCPDGGAFFVFLTGEPRFRRYDARGGLAFERLMQGRELDEILGRQPTEWPRRRIGSDELPLVPPTVRTAAVDPDGVLWVALVTPFIYVFGPDGEKVRVVRLEATGPLLPNSLAFASRSRLLVSPGLYEFRVR